MAENHTFFLRHDVDISPQKAVQMAEVESTAKIKSTYYVLFSSSFYNALSTENIEKFKMIKDMGHGIGLHFDLSQKICPVENQFNEIVAQVGLLEHHVGPLEGMSVTAHKPAFGLEISRNLSTMLNTLAIYIPNLDKRYKYISDSGHNWREDPIEAVMSNGFIQMSTHPEWYNDEEKSMEECLHSLSLDTHYDRLINKEIVSIREYLEKIKK